MASAGTNHFRKDVFILFLLTGWTLTIVCNLSNKANLVSREPRVATANTSGIDSSPHGKNILCIFTGRWKFLRVNFPYVYRDLRKNGGVLDKVYYVMIQYDNETSANLHELTQAANRLLGEDVFQFRYSSKMKNFRQEDREKFQWFYYLIFDKLVKSPLNKYIKMDDDIVYIHSGAFKNLIQQQDSSKCFIHFGNIVSNLYGHFIHQQMGVFKTLNPKNLRFDYLMESNCGWKSAECASLALNTFLHHCHNSSLQRYLFNGLRLYPDRSRFSIQLMLLDINLIDLKHMLESGPITPDDEKWWTVIYSTKVDHRNCVVGNAFVVHFSYRTTSQDILSMGFLAQFESIMQHEFHATLPKELRNTTDIE